VFQSCNLQSAHYFVQRRKKPEKKNKEVKFKNKKGGYEAFNIYLNDNEKTNAN
jgi:hypothetical protein